MTNPLLDEWRIAIEQGRDPEAREELVGRYAFAIPDAGAIEAIRSCSPAGVVEIGAGTGYWAQLLERAGVDVVAFDVAPAGSPTNRWFSRSSTHFPVEAGTEEKVDGNGDRTIVLIWPTRDQTWAADAVERYVAAGGGTLVYVGEHSGGRTGDDRFHALIGDVDRCWACAQGVTTMACVCGITPLFRRVRSVRIPMWRGFDDDLSVYRRAPFHAPLAPAPQGSLGGRIGTWLRRRD